MADDDSMYTKNTVKASVLPTGMKTRSSSRPVDGGDDARPVKRARITTPIMENDLMEPEPTQDNVPTTTPDDKLEELAASQDELTDDINLITPSRDDSAHSDNSVQSTHQAVQSSQSPHPISVTGGLDLQQAFAEMLKKQMPAIAGALLDSLAPTFQKLAQPSVAIGSSSVMQSDERLHKPATAASLPLADPVIPKSLVTPTDSGSGDMNVSLDKPAAEQSAATTDTDRFPVGTNPTVLPQDTAKSSGKQRQTDVDNASDKIKNTIFCMFGSPAKTPVFPQTADASTSSDKPIQAPVTPSRPRKSRVVLDDVTYHKPNYDSNMICEVSNDLLQDPVLKATYVGLPGLLQVFLASTSVRVSPIDSRNMTICPSYDLSYDPGAGLGGCIVFSAWADVLTDVEGRCCMHIRWDVCPEPHCGTRQEWWYTIPEVYDADVAQLGLGAMGVLHMCLLQAFNNKSLYCPITERALQMSTQISPDGASYQSTSRLAKHIPKSMTAFISTPTPSPEKKWASTSSLGPSQSNPDSLKWDDNIPVYDARNVAFNFAKDIPNMDSQLLRWDGEIIEGSFVVCGYTVVSYMGNAGKVQKVTHVGCNIMWVVVCGIPGADGSDTEWN
ncbi:hypothetical protein B0H11DRAFT_1914935 [Mycena galericulata]|nr:hypothetical protein B0H11DRAFT_1914935 [Mycena galericulata]